MGAKNDMFLQQTCNITFTTTSLFVMFIHDQAVNFTPGAVVIHVKKNWKSRLTEEEYLWLVK